MSLNSMTGYGRGEALGENYKLTVEAKSVNHRFKDFRIKMSSFLMRDEHKVKALFEKEFNRGSFDIFVNYKKTSTTSSFADLDENKISDLITTVKENANPEGVQLFIHPTEFLRAEFYKDQDEDKFNELHELLFKALPTAISQLSEMRKEEGAKTKEVLKKHLSDYQAEYEKIKANASGYEESVRTRLDERLKEFKDQVEIDQPRFNQEIIYYLEKLDVTEEFTRIDSHLSKLNDLLETSGGIGRQIDFMVQELGRETNTIGSKSNNKDISDCVIQMKVQLEKIREQGHNIE